MKSHIVPEIAFGIAVIRGVFSVGIGLLLLLVPEKSAPFLLNMMGFFWLITGVKLIVREKDESVVEVLGNRTLAIIAAVAVVAGLFIVTRNVTRMVAPEGVYFALLGIVILLTGIVHLTANLTAGSVARRGHRRRSVLLSVFELVLGLTLVISPLDRSAATYWIATVWALVFGTLVIGDALDKRTNRPRSAKVVRSDDEVPNGSFASSDQVEPTQADETVTR